MLEQTEQAAEQAATNEESAGALFTKKEMSDLIDVTEIPDEDLMKNLQSQNDDEIGDKENLRAKNEEFTGNKFEDETGKPKEAPKTQPEASATNNPQQTAPPAAGAKPVGFEINLDMIPGAFLLDMINGTVKRVEDVTALIFKVRNVPGLSLTDENKAMLEPIADACMKDAKITFKSPWHALGTFMALVVAQNALMGRWEKVTPEREKREVISKSLFNENYQKTKKKKRAAPKISVQNIHEVPGEKKRGRGRPRKNS